MKSAQKKAQTIARQIAQEPLEILKAARTQVSGEEVVRKPVEEYKEVPQDDQVKIDVGKVEIQDKVKASRRMEAFQRELSDIQKEELFKDLQRRIAQGEEIPIEDFTQLSIEQKQVLKAQTEAVRTRKSGDSGQEGQLMEPVAKKSRKLFNFGKKQEMRRQQTRVENVVPPSG